MAGLDSLTPNEIDELTSGWENIELTNKEISAVLESIARALELVSDNPFRSRAYFAAARTVGSYKGSIEDLAREGRLVDLKGVGSSVAESIKAMVKGGSSPLYDELVDKIPPDVWRMLSLPGLGPKRVRNIWRTLGIATLDELERACREGRLVNLEGFGVRIQTSILEGIEWLRRNEGRLLLSAAHKVADELVSDLTDGLCSLSGADSGNTIVKVVGSLRRQCETVDVVEVLVAVPDTQHASLIEAALAAISDEDVRPHRESGRRAILQRHENERVSSLETVFRGARVVVHVCPSDASTASLFVLTGSSDHIDECIRLSPSLFAGTHRFSSEQELYSELGLDYIAPEMREGLGEIERARQRTLPVLVQQSDIKGVFHVHTTYSDGSDSIEDIVRWCRDSGYEYVGIADHSRSAFYAGGLTPADIDRQRDEILRVQQRFPEIRILHGIESDILVDGSLDYDDDVLASFDFVIGSVHSRFSMSREEMTSRIVRAVENPYLSILGHPTGRLLLGREAYQVDLEAVLRALEENGKAVELNADPHRLDLDWKHCIRAKRMGIPVSINPDAHDARGIANVSYGVAIARKGWLSKSDVFNCLSAAEVTERLKSMRGV